MIHFCQEGCFFFFDVKIVDWYRGYVFCLFLKNPYFFKLNVEISSQKDLSLGVASK